MNLGAIHHSWSWRSKKGEKNNFRERKTVCAQGIEAEVERNKERDAWRKNGPREKELVELNDVMCLGGGLSCIRSSTELVV